MISYKDWLKLYYIGAKFAYTFLFLVILFYKDAYGISHSTKYFFFFLSFLYMGINLYHYVYRQNILYNAKLRFLDYLSLFPLFVLSKNIYGLLPATLILGSYSTLYWREIVIVLTLSVILLIFNISFLGFFSPGEFFIAVFYLLSLVLVSAKLNLVGIFRNFEQNLNKLRAEIHKLHSEKAKLSREIRIYKDITEVLELFYSRQRDRNIDKILQNLLGAESVLIYPAHISKRIPPEAVEGCIRISDKDFIVFVKPKEKYLEKDPRYRRKLEILIKIIKPYIETFLAKRR